MDVSLLVLVGNLVLLNRIFFIEWEVQFFRSEVCSSSYLRIVKCFKSPASSIQIKTINFFTISFANINMQPSAVRII